MNVNKLTKANIAKPTRILGVDGSSKSLAFCLMELQGDQWTPVRWGKMMIEGKDVFERCGDVNRKLYGTMKMLQPDYVTFEATIYVNNRSVVIQLAHILGAAIGVAEATGRKVNTVAPTTWMAAIGNPTRDSKEVKAALKRKHPGKTASWYKQQLRLARKQRTLDWVGTKYGIDLDDDDVGDAFGIAYYTTKELI